MNVHVYPGSGVPVTLLIEFAAALLVFESIEQIDDACGERRGAAGFVEPVEARSEQQPLARLVESDGPGGADGFERLDDLLFGVLVSP
jgi:hypothetical protein